MELDASLLNTQHYKVRIKSKVAPPLHIGVVAIEKEASGLPSTMVANFTYLSTPSVSSPCQIDPQKRDDTIYPELNIRFSLVLNHY